MRICLLLPYDNSGLASSIYINFIIKRFNKILNFSEISAQTNINPTELDKTLKSLVDVKILLSSQVSWKFL